MVYDVVERSVIQALESMMKRPDLHRWSVSEWTRRVKTRIADVGEDRGYRVHASAIDCSEDDRHREWLYDLTWHDVDESGRLVDVPLVLESEWHSGGVLYDFQKLLVARVANRVMVFSEDRPRQASKRFKELEGHARHSKLTQSGDRFLLCCWVRSEETFQFRSYVVANP